MIEEHLALILVLTPNIWFTYLFIKDYIKGNYGLGDELSIGELLYILSLVLICGWMVHLYAWTLVKLEKRGWINEKSN